MGVKPISTAPCLLPAQRAPCHRIWSRFATSHTINGCIQMSQIRRNARADCHLSSHLRWILQRAWPQQGSSIHSNTSMTITTSLLCSRFRNRWFAGPGKLWLCHESATTLARIKTIRRSSPLRSKIDKRTHVRSTSPIIWTQIRDLNKTPSSIWRGILWHPRKTAMPVSYHRTSQILWLWSTYRAKKFLEVIITTT